MGEEEENMRDWLENLEEQKGRVARGSGQDLGGGNDGSSMRSREFRRFKEEEREAEKENWYEKLTGFIGQYLQIEPFEDMEEDWRNAIRLLNWNVDLHHITPTAIVVSFLVFFLALPFLAIGIPVIFKLLALVTPLAVFMYLIYYPIMTAKQKVIRSSGDLILAVLYMVIYMRSSPNLEGAVRFVASNLTGDISKDFRRMLWSVQMGRFSTMKEALDHYSETWSPYNKDFVETLNIIETALQENDPQRKDELLEESINNLLDATRQKMKEYSRGLKMPVMVIQGLGVLLPVLIMILFPLISAFMGGAGLPLYLFAGYNIILPAVVYVIMRQVLLSRPPTTSTTLISGANLPPTGRFKLEVGDSTFYVPLLPVSILMFVVMAYWPVSHYLGVVFGSATISKSPSMMDLIRSLMLPASVAFSAGFYLIFGFQERVKKKKEIEQIEEEFPEALYVLGDALRRGTPIEIAIDKAVRETEELKVTDMFEQISRNIKSMGMTFEQAIFDERYGALNDYPSNLIRSIMQAIRESSGKGTSIVSGAMKTISRYLKQVSETQRKIEDMMSDTLSTMVFISYVLAPVISGIAVGMGMIISQAFVKIGEAFGQGNVTGNTTTPPGGSAPVGGAGLGGAGTNPLKVFDFKDAVPPEIIQLIVGFYLIQLSFLLGTFFVKISEGEAPAKRNINIGRILIVGIVLYAITVLLLKMMFGGIIGSLGGF
ncbi:MAG: type II secretion system F family protein [Candidatus Nanohaloarchaea archaeon]|nr:type II secretion system F family protein [Candidatus Nanohaloarchaea archaeon]